MEARNSGNDRREEENDTLQDVKFHSLGAHESQKSEVDVLHFGIDYVRLNFGPGFDGMYFNEFFNGLSINSNQKNAHFFGRPVQVQYAETRQKKILMISFFGDSVICLEKILDGGIVKTISWTITFYGAYFYIPQIQGILNEVIKRYRVFLSVSRVDLALDVTETVNNLWKTHQTITQKKEIIQNSGIIQTFYLGSKRNNKRHFVRVYDKRLDSQKKGKFHLFIDYLEHDVVSRIELQINTLSVRTFGITIFDIENYLRQSPKETRLWDVFKRCCFNTSQTNFPTIKIGSVSLKRVRNGKKRNNDLLDELPYAAVMLGYARRLHEYGFDVLGYLKSRLYDID